MRELAPIEGIPEWRVEEGAQVSAGAVLAWIAGPGRCGLVPIVASQSGRVRWRRSGALEAIAAGEPAVLIDGDEEVLRSCREAERQAARLSITALEREAHQLERDELAHPLGKALLEPQRRGVEARLAVLRALVQGHPV